MEMLTVIQQIVNRMQQDPGFAALFRNDPHQAARLVVGGDTDPDTIHEIVERTKNALAALEAEEAEKDVWRTV